MIEKNSVSASKQIAEFNMVECFYRDGKKRILFVGNSITRHEPKPEIGWENDWGMAASKRENDYVHVAVDLLDERFGKVDYCIVNCGEWEKDYTNLDAMSRWEKARDFCADIIIIRIGENICQAKEFAQKIEIVPYFDKMIEYFRSNKNARVIVTDLFWQCDEINQEICRVAEKNGFTLVKICDLSEDDGNMAIGQFWHEGVAIHPSDRGMKQIAERIVNNI